VKFRVSSKQSSDLYGNNTGHDGRAGHVVFSDGHRPFQQTGLSHGMLQGGLRQSPRIHSSMDSAHLPLAHLNEGASQAGNSYLQSCSMN
jgi:hypothetical protein